MVSDEWYIRTEGKMIGPVSGEVLKQMAQSGLVSVTSEISVCGKEWTLAPDVSGLLDTSRHPEVESNFEVSERQRKSKSVEKPADESDLMLTLGFGSIFFVMLIAFSGLMKWFEWTSLLYVGLWATIVVCSAGLAYSGRLLLGGGANERKQLDSLAGAGACLVLIITAYILMPDSHDSAPPDSPARNAVATIEAEWDKWVVVEMVDGLGKPMSRMSWVISPQHEVFGVPASDTQFINRLVAGQRVKALPESWGTWRRVSGDMSQLNEALAASGQSQRIPSLDIATLHNGGYQWLSKRAAYRGVPFYVRH